ncbi:hypothetical protein [Streptomyces sp. NPDC004726]
MELSGGEIDGALGACFVLDSAGHLGLAVDPNVAPIVLNRLDPGHSKPFRCLPFTAVGI